MRYVEVAVDAAGVPGGRTFTYHVPPTLAGLGVGEAVLVEYGRTRAVGVVLAEAGAPDRDTKPVLERVRSGGPLLPPLQARLARSIAAHYLAPPGMVVRAMVPPGALERVELMAVATPGDAAVGDAAAWSRSSGGQLLPASEVPAVDAVLAAITAAGPSGSRLADLPWTSGRPALLRHLRALQAAGELDLEWRLRAPDAEPRLERRAGLTAAGREAAAAIAAGLRPPGPALGPRQVALLTELGGDGAPETEPTARLSERHGPTAVAGLVRRGLLELASVPVERRPLAGRSPGVIGAMPSGTVLSPAQAAVVTAVRAAIDERRYGGFLVEGVTASGKTAVYVAAISEALRAGRGALVLVPEIALALPLVDRLRHDLDVEPALVHSGLSEGERADEWRRIGAAGAPVVVGTRLAILAPIADPGVIVVDEEHDAAYKSDRTPRYQARDVALELGRLAAIPVLLGSATPDIVSLGRARQGELTHLRLPERASGQGATVEVVDLRAELAEGNRGLLSATLVAAITALDREAGDRAVLVINRRGSATIVVCRDCGYVQVCPDCQRPLVFHATAMVLRCHHCGASAPLARRCPACGSGRIRYLGGGTERVEQEVRMRFPALRVGRLDRDVVERRGAAAAVIDDFAEGRLDVLVGTSLVTKGLDIPEVTLVGVVSADIALNLPDERAAERTYQLLVQAVGRAGRGARPGRAILQSYVPDHPVIRAVADGEAAEFVEAELARRQRYGSPPFGRLVKLTVALADRAAAESTARAFAVELRERADRDDRRVAVLGPVPAYVARRAGRWRFHVVLRGPDPVALLGGDPGPPWSVDVDPESLL